jgi:hypothetical protein
VSLLVPCPGCGRTRKADEGHHLCRQCEGYPSDDREAIHPADEHYYRTAHIGSSTQVPGQERGSTQGDPRTGRAMIWGTDKETT